MFSGKTTELIQRVLAFKKRTGLRVLVINHVFDDRACGETVETHCGIVYPAKKTNNLMLVDVRSFDVIAVDEAQFFTNLRLFVQVTIQNHGKRVIVAGLNADYQCQPFGELHQLLSLADKIDLKQAICYSCGGAASCTKRISNSTSRVEVGGADKYVASCRRCC
tara:strand:+ start:158 stop:649 length:492 start_codon:yes stop_codon:yes gene_type:complete